MSNNLTTLSFNTTHRNKTPFFFNKKSFTLNRKGSKKKLFRKRKRKPYVLDSIITRVGKMPSALYACYHLHMSCLEELQTLCFISDYNDLLQLIAEARNGLSIYAEESHHKGFKEKYEDLAQRILSIATKCDQRKANLHSQEILSKLTNPSKESIFFEEMTSYYANLPF